jgi:hypothetical protein
MHDHTTRQYIAHILENIGLKQNALIALNTATNDDLEIYLEVIKMVAEKRKDIQQLLDFSGLALCHL